MKKTISNTIVYVIVLLLGAGFTSYALGMLSSDARSWVGLIVIGFILLLAIIFTLVYLYERWYFAVYFYDLTPDFIQIKKGPITPREITIPYERIQDVYVDQDLLDRIFGLYDVHLSSATASSGMQAHIDGVEKQSAEGLRAILLETVKQRIGKNRVTNNPSNTL